MTKYHSLARWGALSLVLGLSLTVLRGDAGAQASGVCLFGFSKVVKGEFKGDWAEDGCMTLGRECKTGASRENRLVWSVQNNPARCEDDATCDETKELEGRLSGRVLLQMREQRPCPYRGYYEGSLQFTDPAGLVVATARLQATLGVGTHQKPCVGATCTAAPCENCYDVQFLGNEWRLGTEGSILAPVTDGPYKGCRIRASYAGDFFALGGPGGPVPPSVQPWRYEGKIDGVLECPCGL